MTFWRKCNMRSTPVPGRNHNASRPTRTLTLLALLALSGCATPSVLPLLRLSHEALEAEARHLADERQRDAALLLERQRALSAAFDADLRQRADLDAQWVRQAATGYVAAREALLLHDAAIARERAQRAANLQAAAEAQARAIALLELQEGLWQRPLRTVTSADRVRPWFDLQETQ
jgi:hypothetical protein